MTVRQSGPYARRDIRAVVLALFIVLALGHAQTHPPPAGPPTAQSNLTFRTKVDLVSIPVVVRDSQGHAIGNLSREDFQLYDNGKLQPISSFSVDKIGESAEGAAPRIHAPGVPAPKAAAALPQHYVAYLFDDVNTGFANLVQVRDAAYKHMVGSLKPAERAAVYTTSGHGGVDFTDDREKLRKALFAIRSQNAIVNSIDCPPLSVYQANAIMSGEVMALGAAMADLNACSLQSYDSDSAEWRVRNSARNVMSLADRNINTVLTSLDAVVRKLSLMAGQRTIVLVSSGFLMTRDRREDESAILERAVRANVVVNSLDARALYALAPGLDASAHTIDSHVDSLPAPGAPLSGGGASGGGGSSLVIKAQSARDEAFANRDVMAEVAANTGGRFFENSNDLQTGFARLATAPEYIYVLGFAPQSLKLDGKYHEVKLSLHNPKGLTVEARRGYYAPRNASDPAERSKSEIQEALFSRVETREIPLAVQIQFSKTSDHQAKLSIASKIDVRQLPFRREAGVNSDDVTVVAGVFDAGGNYVMGTQKVLELRLSDETLHDRLASGVTVRNTFDVAPGTYFIRLVVRDAEGQTMAAHGAPVEIR